MSGRQEMDDKYKVATEGLLERTNNILKTYYINMRAVKTASTVYQYIAKLKVFLDYLEDRENEDVTYKMLNSLKPVDINVFLDWYRNNSGKEKSDNTMAFMFNAINSFFIFLEMNEYIDKNPCEKLKAQKVKIDKTPTTLTNDEIKRIADYILYSEIETENKRFWRSRDYLMFMIACRTGLRISAICSIDINDIDFTNNTITVVEKEKETRQIYFGSSTKKLLQDWIYERNKYLGDDKDVVDALFITSRRERMSVVGARVMLEKYLGIIEGKHLTPHKLRATFATLAWGEFGDIYLVASMLGHKNVQTTTRYTDISAKRKKKAANVLDDIF